MGFFDFIKRLFNPSPRTRGTQPLIRSAQPVRFVPRAPSFHRATEVQNAQSRCLPVRPDFFRRCPRSSQGIDDSAVESLVGSTRHHSARQ